MSDAKFKVVGEIEKESEKAVLVNGEWWPRSQIDILDGVIYAPVWLGLEKSMKMIDQEFMTQKAAEKYEAENPDTYVVDANDLFASNESEKDDE